MTFWKALWKFEWGLAAIGAGTCLLAMMLITVLSVFGRYVIHVDLVPGGYNIIERIIFPLIVFWALPLAHREGIFPSFELLSESLGPRSRAVLAVFVLVVEIAIYATLLWFVSDFVWKAVTTGRTMQIGVQVYPMWPIVVMIPLALGLMLVEMVRLVVRDVGFVLKPKSGEEASLFPHRDLNEPT